MTKVMEGGLTQVTNIRVVSDGRNNLIERRMSGSCVYLTCTGTQCGGSRSSQLCVGCSLRGCELCWRQSPRPTSIYSVWVQLQYYYFNKTTDAVLM